MMVEDRKAAVATEPLKQVTNGSAAVRGGDDEAYQALRAVGGRAWQLHAATRAADHYIGQDAAADRNTGSWLVASAVDLAEDVAGELDALARTLKDRPSDGVPLTPLQKLRARAHKLYASTRAADHFLDRDTGEDRSTATWLIAASLEMASKLAADIDDEASQLKRGGDATVPFSEATAGRKGAGAQSRSPIG